jgi:hypothetical protein
MTKYCDNCNQPILIDDYDPIESIDSGLCEGCEWQLMKLYIAATGHD